MNTHLFSRDLEGNVSHSEYLPSEFAEIFTPLQREALRNGQTIKTGTGCSELLWVSATAVCTKMLMGETRLSSVTRLRAQERADWVRGYGEKSHIVAKFDRRTAQLIEAAKRADAAGV